MLKEIIHLNDEQEARRILMRLGNGLPQVENFISEWKAAKEEKIQVVESKAKPVITQKVVTNTEVEKEAEIPLQTKVVSTK